MLQHLANKYEDFVR